jgi:hypothetical protein
MPFLSRVSSTPFSTPPSPQLDHPHARFSPWPYPLPASVRLTVWLHEAAWCVWACLCAASPPFDFRHTAINTCVFGAGDPSVRALVEAATSPATFSPDDCNNLLSWLPALASHALPWDLVAANAQGVSAGEGEVAATGEATGGGAGAGEGESGKGGQGPAAVGSPVPGRPSAAAHLVDILRGLGPGEDRGPSAPHGHSLGLCLAVLRLTCMDPAAFMCLAAAMQRQIAGGVPATLREQVLEVRCGAVPGRRRWGGGGVTCPVSFIPQGAPFPPVRPMTPSPHLARPPPPPHTRPRSSPHVHSNSSRSPPSKHSHARTHSHS